MSQSIRVQVQAYYSNYYFIIVRINGNMSADQNNSNSSLDLRQLSASRHSIHHIQYLKAELRIKYFSDSNKLLEEENILRFESEEEILFYISFSILKQKLLQILSEYDKNLQKMSQWATLKKLSDTFKLHNQQQKGVISSIFQFTKPYQQFKEQRKIQLRQAYNIVKKEEIINIFRESIIMKLCSLQDQKWGSLRIFNYKLFKDYEYNQKISQPKKNYLFIISRCGFWYLYGFKAQKASPQVNRYEYSDYNIHHLESVSEIAKRNRSQLFEAAQKKRQSSSSPTKQQRADNNNWDQARKLYQNVKDDLKQSPLTIILIIFTFVVFYLNHKYISD